METAQHWDRLAKNQPTEIAMFQISEVQESPAFTDRRRFLTLRARTVGSNGCPLIALGPICAKPTFPRWNLKRPHLTCPTDGTTFQVRFSISFPLRRFIFGKLRLAELNRFRGRRTVAQAIGVQAPTGSLLQILLWPIRDSITLTMDSIEGARPPTSQKPG